jgi:hypothetical protein
MLIYCNEIANVFYPGDYLLVLMPVPLIMKRHIYIMMLSVLLFSCNQKEDGKVYLPRPLTGKEDFNHFGKGKEDALSIYSYTLKDQPEDAGEKEVFGLKFRDTTVRLQLNTSDKASLTDRFAVAEYLNTQKTTVLVQVADHSGLTAPFYLIAVKDGSLDVVSIYRSSAGAADHRFTKGLSRIGRSGYLVNNDFFITTVDAKVYPLTRQNPDERIQGIHFLNSPDKKTLVFLVGSSLYQVHYPTDEVYTQPLSAGMPKIAAQAFPWIQHNYSWETNAKGISFLRKNKDDNRVVDIREFNKS